MNPHPKQKVEFDEKFLAHVRSLPCAVCLPGEQRTPTDPAHNRKRQANGDIGGQVMRLCRSHHQIQHSVGVKRFMEWAQTERRVNLKGDAKEMWDKWECGVVCSVD
jgi:hypothetical protein